MHAYIHTYIHINTGMVMVVLICMWRELLFDQRTGIHVCMFIYVCMYVCMYVMYVCMYVHMYVCIYVCMYVHMYVCLCV